MCTSAGTIDCYEYCKSFVQQHDIDGFLSGSLWPRNLQNHYFAIKAFNVEIAMVKGKKFIGLIFSINNFH